MNVLVTGASGFLGSHVAQALLREGEDVTALLRAGSRLDPDLEPWIRRGSLRTVAGSLSDPEALQSAAKRADAVVHVAGLVWARRRRDFLRVNRDGTEALLNALEACGRKPARFVLVSSLAAGGPSRDGRALSEEDPPRPASAYGRSKLAGEERVAARASRFPVTILRPPAVFGPRDRTLAPFFRAIGAGWMVTWGRGGNAFHAVYAADMARACVLALRVPHPSGSRFYIADEPAHTWNSFAGMAAAAAGVRLRTIRVPPALFYAGAVLCEAVALLRGRVPWLSFGKLAEMRRPAWLCTSRKARELLGWAPEVPLEEALRSTHDWYKTR